MPVIFYRPIRDDPRCDISQSASVLTFGGNISNIQQNACYWKLKEEFLQNISFPTSVPNNVGRLPDELEREGKFL